MMRGNVRQRLSAEERQEEIVKAAVDLAGEQGMESVTTQAIADAVGVTQGGVFRHFPTKDSIWIAVVHWARARVMSVVEVAASQASDPLDAVERMFFAHIGFADKNPAVPRVLFSTQPHLKKLLQEMLAGYETELANLLAEAKQAGLVRVDLDVRAAAALYLEIVQGLVIRVLVIGPRASLRAEAEKVFPIYLAGIGAVRDGR
jgi:AcrR family transcriptional regulator